LPDAVERRLNLAYAPPEPPGSLGHLLDLYLPQERNGALPLVVFSGGSGWLRDDGKERAADAAPFFTSAGYAVAGVSVRSSGQAGFPAQLHDGKAAVRWLRANADELGLDAERFAFMGDSSGGWLAVMVGLVEDDPELEGGVGVTGESSRVQAVVDFFGPTDFLQMDAHMPAGCVEFKAFLGIERCHDDPGSPESRLVGGPIEERRDECARANPVRYVRPGAPPLLIIHGQADPFVPHHQSELLFAALAEHGDEATFYSIPNLGHERPYVTDPARAAGQLVRETHGGRIRVLDDAPPPTWETIERFVATALER
jgi:acetyl esterase/lipase